MIMVILHASHKCCDHDEIVQLPASDQLTEHRISTYHLGHIRSSIILILTIIMMTMTAHIVLTHLFGHAYGQHCKNRDQVFSNVRLSLILILYLVYWMVAINTLDKPFPTGSIY